MIHLFIYSVSYVTIKVSQIQAIYNITHCFLYTDEEKDMPAIVEIEYPQLPIVAEGKFIIVIVCCEVLQK